MRRIGVHALISWLCAGCAAERVYDEVLLARFEARVFEDEEYRHSLPYRLFVPDAYDSSHEYPLVLYLHSSSGRGQDNKAQLEFGAEVLLSVTVQTLQESFVLVPQCPLGTQWLNTSFERMPFTNYRQEVIPESDAMKMVVQVITLLRSEFNIDADRLYAMGTSMGASGTWDIVTRYPDLFAAAVTISGVSDPGQADVIAHLPSKQRWGVGNRNPQPET